MTLDIKKTAAETSIAVTGRLDTNTAPILEKAISEDIGDTVHLVLDLQDLKYISSAGLRVLLGAQKKMQQVGSMILKNVCESVMDVLEITGFADILVIE